MQRQTKDLVKTSTWAITEQVTYASAGLLLHIFLARSLTDTAYGAYVFVFASYLLLGNWYHALVTEPMLVFLHKRYNERQNQYIMSLLWLHITISLCGLIFFVLVSALCFGLGKSLLGWTFLSMALVQSPILWMGQLRRVCYARLQPQKALVSGLGYALLLVLSLVVAKSLHVLTPATAFICQAVASVGSIGLLSKTLSLRYQHQPSRNTRREVLRQHWEYGRWSLASSTLNWLPSNLFYILLPIWGGLSTSGLFRMVMNLILPMNHVNMAMEVQLPSIFAHQAEGQGVTRTATRAFGGLLFINLMYAACLCGGGQLLFRLCYAKSLPQPQLLWLLAFLPALMGAGVVLGSLLRAKERPDRVFWGYLASALWCVIGGVVLVSWRPAVGAAIAMLVAYGFITLGNLWGSCKTKASSTMRPS